MQFEKYLKLAIIVLLIAPNYTCPAEAFCALRNAVDSVVRATTSTFNAGLNLMTSAQPSTPQQPEYESDEDRTDRLDVNQRWAAAMQRDSEEKFEKLMRDGTDPRPSWQIEAETAGRADLANRMVTAEDLRKLSRESQQAQATTGVNYGAWRFFLNQNPGYWNRLTPPQIEELRQQGIVPQAQTYSAPQPQWQPQQQGFSPQPANFGYTQPAQQTQPVAAQPTQWQPQQQQGFSPQSATFGYTQPAQQTQPVAAQQTQWQPQQQQGFSPQSANFGYTQQGQSIEELQTQWRPRQQTPLYNGYGQQASAQRQIQQ